MIDNTLRNRSYTWSSKRPVPSFSKLDRVFTSADWHTDYPVITLEALEMVVSDHVPLLLTCKNMTPVKKSFRLETFWFKYEIPRQMVKNLWTTPATGQLTSLSNFRNKTELLHKALHLWHKECFNKMEKELTSLKGEILIFDRKEETEPLTGQEFKNRCMLKEKAFEIANNIEERWRQRSRCNWLQQGDKNTRFFHLFASTRLNRNKVRFLLHEGQQVSDLQGVKMIFFEQIRSLLGSSNPVKNFNPTAMYENDQSLCSLDDPFSEPEVEVAVRQLAKNKASGPDGIPNEFLKVYWPDIKMEIM